MAPKTPFAGRALICSPLMPEFDRESGSRRIYNLIEFLVESGWHVTFACRDVRDGARYVHLLQQHGVATCAGFGDPLEQVVRAMQFDIALLAFWHVADELLPMIRRESPGTRILVDTIDLHFLRNARQTFLNSIDRQPQSLGTSFATEFIKELNVYAAADGVLTVSRKEADLVNDFIGEANLAAAVPDCEDLPPSPVPFEQRRGIVFVGNFRHAPNVSAVRFLCEDVLPLIPPQYLAEHPVSIIGTDPPESVRGYAKAVPNVRLVGWVPSVLPYLHQARVTVVPLLYGAGTKRKLLQSLLVGTPAVSTTVGVEGLALQDEQHVLIADSPTAFAAGITRLLYDMRLWQEISTRSQTHLQVHHGRETARTKLLEHIASVRIGKPKLAPRVLIASEDGGYPDLIRRIHCALRAAVPGGAKVLFVSRGDLEIVNIPGIDGQHFPQTADGVYAGQHPADSRDAIAHLKDLIAQGGEYLLFPRTAFWWLDHYTELRSYLESHATRLIEDSDCILFGLLKPSKPTAAPHDGKLIESLRPKAEEIRAANNPQGLRVLVLGIYLANQPNLVDDTVAVLGATSRHHVTQKWVALLGPTSPASAHVTIQNRFTKIPKFELLNELIAAEDLAQYDYVMLFDDDVVIPHGFVDHYFHLLHQLDFVISQPARTSNSYIDHPIVEQQKGTLARQTRFVEIGPVVCFHRSVFDLVFPFDLTSPMGWGFENIWSFELVQRGLTMGIIDAVPVDHSTRKPVANYNWSQADQQRRTLFQKHAHFTNDECFRVIKAYPCGVEL